MEEIKITLTAKDYDKAQEFSDFRELCKKYLSKVGKNWDKFTVVSHDSFIGYITENAIIKYLKEIYKTISIETWEEQFDMEKIKQIVGKGLTDDESIALVTSYFYDSWDIKIESQKFKVLSDVKTALTAKEPSSRWNFLYPVVQAEKGGKDIMILVYYVVASTNDLRSFSKLVLVGAITPERIKKCKIIRAGERTVFGTTSQIDNYITELSRDYSPLSDFIKV